MRKVVRNVLGVSISVLVASAVVPGGALLGASAATSATISGTVTDGTLALAGIDVAAYQLVAGTWTAVGSFGRTGPDGTYTIDGLEDGTYRVGFEDLLNADFAPEFYDDAATVQAAQSVSTSAASPAPPVDAVLEPASRIRGTVTGPGGLLTDPVVVTAYQFVGGSWQPVPADPTTTKNSGAYDLGGLRGGTYRLGFRDTSGDLAIEFSHDAPTVDEAGDVTVLAGDTSFGNDAVLAAGGHITGKVTNGAGAPVAATVVAHRKVGGAWKPVATTLAGLDGTYDLAQLAAGAYRVGYTFGAIREFWDDQGTLDAAQDVTIAPGSLTATGRNAVLVAGEHDPRTTPPAPQVPAPAPPAPAAAKAVTNTKLPHVVGKPRVGTTLRVSSGAWSPSIVSWKVQWLANGTIIKKATKMKFEITRKQVGKRLSVRITASAAGYQPATVTTASTGKVR